MLPRSPQGPSVRKRTAESINERGGVKLPAAHLKITPAGSRLGTGCLAGQIQRQLDGGEPAQGSPQRQVNRAKRSQCEV